MVNVRSKENCCGCSICSIVCPTSAIVMKPDEMGFLYPKIDTASCVNCGLCEKVCAFNKKENEISVDYSLLKAYAARNIDIHEVNTSRSGACFVALSDYILDKGGSVYGVGFKEHFVVAHKRAIDKAQRQEFKGSKYAQSNMHDIIPSVMADLMNGMYVCFSGTPCQTSAIRSCVPKKYHEKLYLIDLVCHGVASPKVWQSYISYIEKKYRGKVESLNFRDKVRFGWKDHRETFVVRGKIRSLKKTFYQDIYFRPSCSNCSFTNLNRPSDITIADFWGIENVAPEYNKDDKGCNLLIVNTEKGNNWLKSVLNQLDIKEVRIQDSLQYNLQYPTKRNPLSADFTRDYNALGFEYAMRHYCGWGTKNYLISIVRKICKKN